MSFYASSRYPVTFRPADREPSKFGPSVTHDGFYYYEPDIMFEQRLGDQLDGDSFGLEALSLDPNESAQLHLFWNSSAEGLYYLDLATGHAVKTIRKWLNDSEYPPQTDEEAESQFLVFSRGLEQAKKMVTSTTRLEQLQTGSQKVALEIKLGAKILAKLKEILFL